PYRAQLQRCPTAPPARSGVLPRALPCSPALPCLGTPDAATGPEPLGTCPAVPYHVRMARPLSGGTPPLASLFRAHAPVLPPPCASRVPSPPGLGRVRSAPAGSRPCPTFSRRLCPGVRGPLPRQLVACGAPFLPPRQRPAPRAARVGAQHSPDSACRTAPCSR